MLGRVLHGLGYVIAHVLFLRASSPETVVRRLRVAYRLVGVRIVDTTHTDGAERTVFRCPYRSLATQRFGEKGLCHRKLDRVDDGYVTYLRRHKNIQYRRPRGCANLDSCEASEHCYSEVSD
ncbi:MAG: hypothetical protein A07HR60_00224 [uncultured archaeon A07HR60]|nr:MAG: hypothetical protein A07HR60_00224 [uncultured archaeon A07HR60]